MAMIRNLNFCYGKKERLKALKRCPLCGIVWTGERCPNKECGGTMQAYKIEAGDVFYRCNFTQARPDTDLSSYIPVAVTMTECNLFNCTIPHVTTEHCLIVQRSQCSHLHPELRELGLIPECAENCAHKVSDDRILIDGVPIKTVSHYQDTRLA